MEREREREKVREGCIIKGESEGDTCGEREREREREKGGEAIINP